MNAEHTRKREPGWPSGHPRIKLGLVCTSGGHFEQMQNLSDFYGAYPHFWITSRNEQTEHSLIGEKRYFVRLAHFKEPWTYLSQIPACLRAFVRERPTHLISTGSGRVAFFPFLLSVVSGTKFIHIETFSHVHSLTKLGRFLVRLKHPIYSQWRSAVKPVIGYIGPIMKSASSSETGPKTADHVFVTLGTRTEPFPRLIRAVETLVQEGVITERVIVQAGHTKYESNLMEIFGYRPPAEIDGLVRNASYVITQESAGIGTKCLKYRTKMIVMPRDYSFGELPAKSDMNEDLHFRLRELGFASVVENTDDLKQAILQLDGLNIGFRFDNSLAVAKLRELVEDSPGRSR